MSRHFLRPLVIGSILLLQLLLLAVPAGAGARPPSGLLNPSSVVHAQHFIRSAHIDTSYVIANSGRQDSFHYLYAETGTSPDSIDVYYISTTLIHIGNYPTDAQNGGSVSIGEQRLAIATQDQAHGNCLLLADGQNFSSGMGYLDSFAIQTNGSLTAEVSHLKVKATKGYTEEVHVSGDIAYVDNVTSDFESYAIGAGCALTYVSSAKQKGQDTNFALAGSALLVAPNTSTNALDVYKLSKSGKITFVRSTKSQFPNPEGGVAVQVTQKSYQVFTGQCCFQPAMAQGGTINKTSGKITFLKGSPASDANGNAGINEVFDSTDGLLLQGEFYSQTLASYTVANGSIAFQGEATLADSANFPQDLALFGSTLFVLGLFDGDIEACSVANTGISGCATVAITTSANVASGLVIL